MTRIESAPERGLARVAYRVSRRRYDKVLDPLAVFAHHPKILAGYSAFETAIERSHRVDEALKGLAVARAASLVGCEWCLDFGSHELLGLGVSREKLMDLPMYAESPHYDVLERLVLDYATAMTRTPAEVSDELFAALREHFDEGQLVELTTAIAIENFRARFNWAFGMAGQDMSEGAVCLVQAAVPSAA